MLTAVFVATLGILLGATAFAQYSPDYGNSNGPQYVGAADRPLAADFISAGGGPGSFSFVRAWDRMIGRYAMEGDINQLAATYGWHDTNRFIQIANFAITDSWNRYGADNIHMPFPSGAPGRPLAQAIVRAGEGPTGNLWTDYMLGQLDGPRVYSEVSADIAGRYGPYAEKQFARVGSDFLRLVARQVHMYYS
jgi:hypothetical protein